MNGWVRFLLGLLFNVPGVLALVAGFHSTNVGSANTLFVVGGILCFIGCLFWGFTLILIILEWD